MHLYTIETSEDETNSRPAVKEKKGGECRYKGTKAEKSNCLPI